MLHRVRMLVVAALCVAVVAPAAAARDDAALDAARRLIEVTKVTALAQSITGRMIAQMRPLLRQAAPRLTDQQLVDFEAAFEDEMSALVPALSELNARNYAEAFTVEELEALIAFYETPVGQKTIDTLPGLMQRSMSAGAVLGREAGVRAMRAATERMRAKGYDL